MSPKRTDDETHNRKHHGNGRRGLDDSESPRRISESADKHPKGPRVKNPNSKDKADRGVPYERIRRPKDADDAVEAIDVWGRYLHQWGVRVDQEFHGLYWRLQAAGNPRPQAAGTATTHLDPPPEPFK